LEDNDKDRRKEEGYAERSRKEGDKIEEGDHLQEDQCEGAQELRGADDRERA
jgi:hypothetical protein